LDALGRSLVNSFFLEEDRQLVERKKELIQLEENKEDLAAVSGIRSEEILQRLVQLKVRPEILAALAVVPLVEVVWADGTVDDEERKVVFARAAEQGIAAGSVEHDLLGRWLTLRPGPTLFEAWQQYVRGLCQQMTPAERQSLKAELLVNVNAAAEASGGFLGIGRTSTEERIVLTKLEASFADA